MPMNMENVQEKKMNPGSIPTIWSHFRDAVGDDYFHYWLALQSALVSNAVHGLLVMGVDWTDSYEPVAGWPESNSDFENLTDICENTLEQRCGLLSQLPSADGSPRYAVSYPILVDNVLHGVVALEVAAASESELCGCMEQLQWGVAWLELFFRRRQIAEETVQMCGMKASFDLLASVLAEEKFNEAATVFVTELATVMKCDRVSLGFVKKSRIRMEAISHNASFSKQMNLVQFIGAAMEEALLQRSEIIFPSPSGARMLVLRDHEELARRHNGESILTIALHAKEKYYGAITLERGADSPFREEEISVCRGIVALIAPVLEEKRQNDRLLVQKAAESLKTQAQRLLGRGYAGRKLVLGLLILLVTFFSFAEGQYRLTATSTLEPLVRRSIASPFNGYVKDSAARSGDLVKKGAVLCNLDSRDLHLERGRWLNQQTQYQRQRQEALAMNDRAKANIITSQIDQANAQLSLVQNQLKRTSLVAPFDGIVVSGDLSQRIDGSVEQGEVLFELAPLNSYRVILQVDEYRIADVSTGQKGVLVLPALAGSGFDFVVDKITPMSSQKDGKNYFRVEARLLNSSDTLRPGMEGVGKIQIDRRKLIKIWTRDMLDWMRLKVWYWWP
jgi:multidrug resistance efflux pump